MKGGTLCFSISNVWFWIKCHLLIKIYNVLYVNVRGSATWLDLYRETVTQQTLRQPNGLAPMSFKSSSVINLVYSCKANQTRFECSVLFSWSYQGGLLSLSLHPQILPISTLYRRTVNNKTSWSNINPRQTRICYIFRLWVVIKARLKQISLYLLLALGLSC